MCNGKNVFLFKNHIFNDVGDYSSNSNGIV